MKKFLTIVFAGVFMVSPSFADIEDTSIIDELNKNEQKVTAADFKLQKFETCTDMQEVMSEYIKLYWENSSRWWYWWWYIFWGSIMEEVAEDGFADTSSSISSPSMNQNSSKESMMDTGWAWEVDYSETNIQVSWVDESDIIKTDGKYIYYYNYSDNYVYIVSTIDKKVMKKIKVPDTFYSPVLYIWDWKLTILSDWYTDYNYNSKSYWIDRKTKTYVIVYDIADVSSPKLDKIYILDWNMTESRKIWDYIYVVSNVNFYLPYYNYKTFEDADFSLNKIMPQKIEVTVNGTKANMTTWNAADCNNISYVLPDAETIQQFGLSPSYNIVSIIDTKNPSNKTATTVIAWSTNEIYMSLDNLYLTSYMYRNASFACPAWANCIFPSFSAGANTLVHKLNVDWTKLSYQNSTILPWTPLTQYSMDEYKENFRIITQTNNWTRSTNESYVDLYILDKNLNLVWSLQKLWEWERFQSSRYIWEKLFLVTFEQIDPLFAIDVADPKNPKVLWELKIPWYSTYLHPYDDNHLIWLWFDTTESQWGGIVNAGLKIDLYQINYDKKCGDSNLTAEEKAKCDSWDYKWIIVKQLYSETLWWQWSSSEATYNPRMFMWNSAEKKLFLPVTLYYRDENYRNKDFFQWLATFTINKDSGIKKDYDITHIDYTWLEAKRLEECEKYAWTNEPKCVKLITWEEYCWDRSYSYVPSYCYADSTIWEYIASNSWSYSKYFIERALWIGNEVYAISNNKVTSHNMSNWNQNYQVEMVK